MRSLPRFMRSSRTEGSFYLRRKRTRVGNCSSFQSHRAFLTLWTRAPPSLREGQTGKLKELKETRSFRSDVGVCVRCDEAGTFISIHRRRGSGAEEVGVRLPQQRLWNYWERGRRTKCCRPVFSKSRFHLGASTHCLKVDGVQS